MKWWRYCSSETGCWAFTPDAHLPRVQRKWIPDHTFQDGLSSGPIPGMKTCFTLHQTYWSLRAHCSLTPPPPKSKTKRNLHHQSSEFVASPHVKGRDSSLHSVLDESRSLWNGDKRRTRPKTTNRIPSGLRGWERRTRDMEFVVMTTVTKANQAGVPIL